MTVIYMYVKVTFCTEIYQINCILVQLFIVECGKVLQKIKLIFQVFLTSILSWNLSKAK